MIPIYELTEQDIGKWVLYDNRFGKLEKGRIKSWNNHWIFVVYKCDNQWDRFNEYTGYATCGENLSYLNSEVAV